MKEGQKVPCNTLLSLLDVQVLGSAPILINCTSVITLSPLRIPPLISGAISIHDTTELTDTNGVLMVTKPWNQRLPS